MCALCFSLSAQRLYRNDHEWLSVVRTGCPLCETAPDGWMDVLGLGRTGITHWTDKRIRVPLSSFCLEFIFFLPSLEFFLSVVGTWNIYSSGFDHLLCVWCGKYLEEGVQRDPVWVDRTSATDKAPFLISSPPPFFNLCVMYVEWRQRMDIIWEILIILQANFIVCISGELWASSVSFGHQINL